MRRLALALAVTACTPSAVVDGGVDGSSDAITFDGPLACAVDASVPNTDDAGNIETIKPAHAPHQNACTSGQIADYAQCQGAKTTALCTQFEAGQSAEACGKCIETKFEDPEWGVLVFSGSTAFFNVEGCVNVALGQNGQPDSCGQELHNLYGCQEAICASCSGVDFSSCELEALQDACISYDQTVFSPTGPCSALTGDAAPPPDTESCFPDASLKDPTQQEIDWLTRIVGYMCGP